MLWDNLPALSAALRPSTQGVPREPAALTMSLLPSLRSQLRPAALKHLLCSRRWRRIFRHAQV